MFPAVVGLLGGGVALYLIARWWTQATPHQLAVALRWAAIVAGIGVIVFAAVTRRWGLLATLAFPALMLWRGVRAARTHNRNARGASPGQGSAVETRFLRMRLDHDSGAMAGEVVAGDFAGRELDDLNLGELIALWRVCVAEDEQSRIVLEAWLDRVHGDMWRQAAGGAAADGGRAESAAGNRAESPWTRAGMSEAEAREILGVGETASREDIDAAYRKAMLRAHPDQGGSDWLAARVNQARDTLLKR
jgi:hypothetical protein